LLLALTGIFIWGRIREALAAERLRASERLISEQLAYQRALLDSLPNPIFVKGPDSVFTACNRAYEEAFGISRDELIGKTALQLDYFSNEARVAYQEADELLIHEGGESREEISIGFADGVVRDVLYWRQTFELDDGTPAGLIGILIDITERKLAEKAVQESEEKYRSIFNSGPNPIFVLDRTTLEILDANPMAEETYGYSKEEMRGRSFSFLGPAEEIKARLTEFDQNSWPEACVVGSKVQHYRKRNVPFYARVTACPIRYKNSDAVILATTDLTEMLEKEAQLLQASKMTTLGEMSAGIAHELNQPLNAIKMGSDYLTMMVEDRQKIAEKNLVEVAQQISGQVDRAVEIINRLREFGRKPDFVKKRGVYR